MPRETFHKLKEEKKKKLIDGFLREFSIKTYDEASLSSAVKSLGIAKGSIYQYFDNKLDLFLFLVGECSAVKQTYIGHLKREDFPDFWTYFKALYEEGVKFDLENPLQSHFLHSLAKNINSPSIQEINDKFQEQTIAAFAEMIRYEVTHGHFRDDLPLSTMAFFLYKTSLSINDHMQLFYDVNPEVSIQKKMAVYADQKDQLLMKTVDEYVHLLRQAFDPQSND
ncbi:TetR/AcrR family transcriptional regulator [Catalinimonas alkaloidigena]|uniref:TetR/AcrR family transcriptional regulator n=1 Tax=Catalinimonas alkaloidigena TaxID=1075417 RepID=UPI00240710AE|nr:TetR/AcrR family transcriptional regulator [Catalinimonas alkaloidigena]